MVSQRSLQPLLWATRFGLFIGTFPAKWDSKQGQFVPYNGPLMCSPPCLPRKLRVWTAQVAPLGYTLYQSVLFAPPLLFLITFFPLSLQDKFLLIFTLIALALGLVPQVQFLRNFDEFCCLINAFFKFDQQMRMSTTKFNKVKIQVMSG